MGGFFTALGDVFGSETMYASAIRFATVLLFAALGELVAERSGALNISVEGMLLGGAFAGALGYDATGSTVVGLVVAAVIGGLIGGIQANLSHRLTADQFVVGLTLNILLLGLAAFLDSSLEPEARGAEIVRIPGLADIPLLGPGLFAQPWPLYLVYALVPATWWLLYRTRWGLEVRAVGEDPQAADVSGVHVNARRREAVVLAGVTSGLGGGFLVLGQIGSFEPTIIGGQGFIAIAAVIFGGWTIKGTIAGCLLFGTVNSFRLSLPGLGHPLNPEFLQALPFLATIAVVAVFAHRTRQPAALARPFLRGLK